MGTKLTQNKNFLLLMIAQGISSIGDWLSIVAIITLVGLKWEATPMEMSFIILSLALPMAIFGPITGTFADKMERKFLMVFSDLIRGGLILILTIVDQLWSVYLCLFLVGIFSAIFVPAKNGKLKELVEDHNIRGAMSITSMIDSATKVIGPLVSGILVTAFGTYTVFYIDSTTFVISATLLFLLPKTIKVLEAKLDGKQKEKSSFLDELKVGFSFIKQSNFLMIGLTLLVISLLILQLSDSQIIVLLRQLTNVSPDLFGYAVTFSGVGMLGTGFYLSKKKEYKAFRYMIFGILGMGLGFGVMTLLTQYDLSLSILWVPGCALVAGASAGLVFIPFQVSAQEQTPVHMTGRVFGVINSSTTIAVIIGPLLGGWLATVVGIVPSFLITSSLLVILSFGTFICRKKIEQEDANVTESKSGTQGAATN